MDILDILNTHDKNLEIYNFLDGSGNKADSLTVEELIKKIGVFAKQLERFKVGERALLLFPTSKEFIVSFFGCLHAGIIPVPVSLPGKRNGISNIEFIYEDSDASALIFDESSFARISGEVKNSKLAELPVLFVESQGDCSSDTVPARRYEKSGIAFLQYTSGSTSAPKGVIVTHMNIIANQEMIHERFDTKASSIFLGWTPLHHDMGLIGNVMQPMFVGGKSYLISPITLLMRPKVWLKILSDYKVSVTGGPNFSYKHIVRRVSVDALKRLELNLSSLKVLYNGAEPIELDVLEKFCEIFSPYGFQEKAFLPCYGLAEATLIVSGVAAHEHIRSKSMPGLLPAEFRLKETKTLVSSGHAMNGVEIRVTSQDLRKLLSPNEVGVIEVKGDSVSPGYWNRETRNGEWLDTGDLGFVDELGDLYICGREKDVIIVDGRNIYPQDLELCAETVKSDLVASEFGAFGLNDQVYLVAELSKISLRNISDDLALSFKNAIRKKISSDFGVRVEEVILVGPNSIPKTTSFKIQRQKLKNYYISNQITETTHHG